MHTWVCCDVAERMSAVIGKMHESVARERGSGPGGDLSMQSEQSALAGAQHIPPQDQVLVGLIHACMTSATADPAQLAADANIAAETP